MSALKFVLFGSTGDLARLKILPALLELQQEGELATDFELIAVGRRDYSNEDFFKFLKEAEMHPLQSDLSPLNPSYLQLDWDKSDGFAPLADKLEGFTGKIILFLSLGYEIVEMTLDRFEDEKFRAFIANHDINISVEKPFGGSYKQAQEFNHRFEKLFEEGNVYRNDHIVFKKPILAFDESPKCEAKLLSLMMGAKKMRIVYAEELKVGSRVDYYEGKGVSMDMFQSHLLQMAAMALNECSLDDLKSCKARFIESLKLVKDSVVKAQYQSYQENNGAKPELETETFLRAVFMSELPEYGGIMFEFLSGKGLGKKEVLIDILDAKQEWQRIFIHPELESAIALPQEDNRSYHRLILALIGDNPTHFISQQEVEAQWKVTEELRETLRSQELEFYEDGLEWEELAE